EPLEMMAGEVLPPGCFLDAPEMLKRQFVAHAMDAWATQETEVRQIPAQTTFILGPTGRASFPGRRLDFYRKSQAAVTEAFFARFGALISTDNRKRLEEFATGDDVPRVVAKAFDDVQTERNDLRRIQKQALRRIQEIEKDPDKFEDPDAERRDAEETRKLVSRL